MTTKCSSQTEKSEVTMEQNTIEKTIENKDSIGHKEETERKNNF